MPPAASAPMAAIESRAIVFDQGLKRELMPATVPRSSCDVRTPRGRESPTARRGIPLRARQHKDQFVADVLAHASVLVAFRLHFTGGAYARCGGNGASFTRCSGRGL